MENENDYLEAMNDLQKKYDKFQEEKENMIEEIKDLKKNLSSMYGLIRVLDIVANVNGCEADENLKDLISLTRSFASDIFEIYVLKIN
tara:strand:+ start:2551 stop:2814 length:264 start_codon:yes stop_codon:yes gene_type:complete